MSGFAPPDTTPRWTAPVSAVGGRDAVREAALADARSALSRTTGAQILHHRDLRNRALLVGMDLAVLLFAAGLGELVGPPRPPALLTLVLVPTWLLALAARGGYNRHRVGTGTAELSGIVAASGRVGLAAAVLAYLAHLESARGTVLVTLPVGAALLALARLARRAVLARAGRDGDGGHRVLAVGTVSDVLHLVERARSSPGAGFRVIGACVPQYRDEDRRRPAGRRGSRTRAPQDQRDGDRRADPERRAEAADLAAVGVPVLGTQREVLAALDRGAADAVVVTGQSVLSRHALRRLAWQLEGTAVELYVASALTDVAIPRITLRALGGMSLLHVHAPALGGGRLLLKSALDRLAAAAALVILGPVLVVLGALIRLDSPGPALYRQERIGLAGRTFRCHKLRTMRQGADQEQVDTHGRSQVNEVLFKLPADPRVTAVGRVLRRYSLDELPQLLNVLGGSMSLVGPRPPLPTEVAVYGNDVQRRLIVKPGMTGLWQVSGRSDLSWAESVRLDLYYVENWSLSLDLSLLARTVTAVARARGAY
jgi:lipopolysaccharide/colanic/teichoic acid biosynthesis glycosyltransferase